MLRLGRVHPMTCLERGGVGRHPGRGMAPPPALETSAFLEEEKLFTLQDALFLQDAPVVKEEDREKPQGRQGDFRGAERHFPIEENPQHESPKAHEAQRGQARAAALEAPDLARQDLDLNLELFSFCGTVRNAARRVEAWLFS